MRDSAEVWTRAGGGALDVYCCRDRLNRTGTTRGSGKVHFQILIRNSDGRFVKGVKVSILFKLRKVAG